MNNISLWLALALLSSTFIPLLPKSLYIGRTGRLFYGTENENWAGFRPVENTLKKIAG